MGRLREITPMVPVADFDAGLRFFTDTLGFELRLRLDDRYAYLRRITWPSA